LPYKYPQRQHGKRGMERSLNKRRENKEKGRKEYREV
jgi:hypothetical protein